MLASAVAHASVATVDSPLVAVASALGVADESLAIVHRQLSSPRWTLVGLSLSLTFWLLGATFRFQAVKSSVFLLATLTLLAALERFLFLTEGTSLRCCTIVKINSFVRQSDF